MMLAFQHIGVENAITADSTLGRYNLRLELNFVLYNSLLEHAW